MKRALSLFLALILALGLAAPAAAEPAPENTLVLNVPAEWELSAEDSRTVDYAFSEGTVNRMLTWNSSDEAIASVDEWGRVTGVSPGVATITATPADTDISAASATVTVTAQPTDGAVHPDVVNYAGEAVEEVENLQKVVTRYAVGDAQVPADVSGISDYTDYQTATTADEAVWTITGYGVLRTGGIAATSRDAEMRFMGDRYFYKTDTTANNVLGIVADGGNGIWTIMTTGYTHIAMTRLSAADKAAQMSETTQENVSRRGMVADANLVNGEWVPQETDNDGLWTAMYGAGELMRYASLKRALAENPYNTKLRTQTEEARETATLSTEAVLLLSNISMRTGDVEAYVKSFSDGGYTLSGSIPVLNDNGKQLSGSALIQGGDYSLSIPSLSPSVLYYGSENRQILPLAAVSWAVPSVGDHNTYATRTRSLGGFIARTYSLHGEAGGSADTYNGTIYYDFADYSEENKTAVGKSSKEGVVNGEILKGVQVDASGDIPSRLWDDLLGADVDIQDVVYKGDTSTDEIIGHLFIYKLAYDILGPEDAELRQIIADTMDGFAQHLSDNSYLLVDATGQPTTWGKMSREYFYTYRWGAPSSPLTASVLLCAFKVAAYCTGYQKWEDEYRFLLENGSYLYDDVMNQHSARNAEFLNLYAAPMLGSVLGGSTLTQALTAQDFTAEESFLLRTFAQYSDEEMAMLAFYLLFQMETDAGTLATYRSALDQWWNESMQYSENPLWYYIYQLAYPDNTNITDAYGNNILETAAWSLSRHPIDTRKWTASNSARDDLMIFNLEDYSSALDTRGGLSIKKTTLPSTQIGAEGIIGVLLYGGITNGTVNIGYGNWTLDVEYAVAAPDERALHKYNGSSYLLNDDNPNQMEGSTTYTLPYWMGVYHGMLQLSDYVQVAPPTVTPTQPQEPTPASELFDDVAADAWYHDAVTYVADAGLFKGVSEKLFAPDAEMTRGMLATVLYRYAGAGTQTGDMPFGDVLPSDYFYAPVRWAAENGFVTGVSPTQFAPELAVTREQVVTILYRYAAGKGEPAAGADFSGFADAAAVSDYAREAVSWAVGAGILSGRNGNLLAPKDSVTRAELAAIFQRFAKL